MKKNFYHHIDHEESSAEEKLNETKFYSLSENALKSFPLNACKNEVLSKQKSPTIIAEHSSAIYLFILMKNYLL